MKRIISLTLSLILCLSLFGCTAGTSSQTSSQPQSQSSSPEASQAPVSSADSQASLPTEELGSARIAALKGPTAMGMVKLLSDDAASENPRYEFTLAASADEITPQLVQGQLDIAAVPANLASVLYNNTQGQVQVLAVNTLGVLYIVENGNTVTSVEDLRGKTIYASGKGSTPEYALSYMLEKNGIDPEADVTIEWKSEHSECVAAISAEENAIALLPQPFVTTAQLKNENLNIVLDINSEWEKQVSGEDEASALITGVAVVRTEFAKENPRLVEEFLQQYEASAAFVNDDVQSASALIGEYDIVPQAVAEKAIPYCNITFIKGEQMKEKLSAYLQTLYDYNPKAVGGVIPDEAFYHIG